MRRKRGTGSGLREARSIHAAFSWNATAAWTRSCGHRVRCGSGQFDEGVETGAPRRSRWSMRDPRHMSAPPADAVPSRPSPRSLDDGRSMRPGAMRRARGITLGRVSRPPRNISSYCLPVRCGTAMNRGHFPRSSGRHGFLQTSRWVWARTLARSLGDPTTFPDAVSTLSVLRNDVQCRRVISILLRFGRGKTRADATKVSLFALCRHTLARMSSMPRRCSGGA